MHFFEAPLAEPEPPRELAVYAVEQDAAFVSNIELLLGKGPVTGSQAERVRAISPRAIWYPGYAHVILPEAPTPHFIQYTNSFGVEPNIIVPRGINPANLSMYDGFRRFIGRSKRETATAIAIKDRVVESYIADPKLSDFVTFCGGIYAGGPPEDKFRLANNKAAFAQYAEGVVDVPEGEVVEGLDAAARAVQKRLLREGSAFVRQTQLGGGFGNHSFTADGNKKYSLKAIKDMLAGGHPETWKDTQALVEEHLGRIAASPAVNFGWSGFSFDNMQLIRDGAYRGSLSPVPDDVIDPGELRRIGETLQATIQKRTGYYGPGNVDLGTLENGRLVGFEFNARHTGARHGIAIGELLVGPWKHWRENNQVALSIDQFTLRKPMHFDDLYAILEHEELLASKDRPEGVVISIPPYRKSAGIHIQAKGYRDAASLHKTLVELIGDPDKNTYDHPLDFA